MKLTGYTIGSVALEQETLSVISIAADTSGAITVQLAVTTFALERRRNRTHNFADLVVDSLLLKLDLTPPLLATRFPSSRGLIV